MRCQVQACLDTVTAWEKAAYMAISGHLCQWAFAGGAQITCVGASGPWDPQHERGSEAP